MAMGRGLTLQCGDDAVNLTRSWNTREPRLGAGSPKPGLIRKPDASFHNKKHGGHFQLAVNFQARANSPSQLVTPASLMSAAAKGEDQAKDAFEDARSEEEDISDDEDSLCNDEDEVESDDDCDDDDDSDDDDSDSHAKSSTLYNYSQTLEDEEGHSSCDDVALQETKDSDEEVEDALEFILQEKLEIEKRQFGFIALEDTINQNRGKKSGVGEKGKLIKPRSLSNTSSDKENIDIQDINSLKSSQRFLQNSTSHNGITGWEKPISFVEKGIPKQPLKTCEKQNVTEWSVRKDFPPKSSVDEPGAVNVQGRWDQNREKDENEKARHETSVNENKKDTLTREQIMSRMSPVHQDIASGKVELEKTKLSPHAAPFVPLPSTSCSVKGRAERVDAVSQDRVGPHTEQSLWSSEYDSQQVNSPQVPEIKRLLPQTQELSAPTNPVQSPLRSQAASNLSDKELENEYEWRKYKLIRKVKQILKPQTSDDGKSSLQENCVSQLCGAMTEASSSFVIFTTFPKELAIVLEEVVRQSVEETVLDDVYQKDFIALFHKLSAFSPHFDQDLKTAIKHVEKHFLQPFIGAHLEKLGLRYCQFLGRLYASFCQAISSTKETLEEIIFALCKKWIIFNEEGTNLNAEVTEVTFAKCLQAITKEIGPFCPQDKWKRLMSDVKGQIFSKRPQNVKEIFLEILLHSEGVVSNSESATSESVVTIPSKEENPSPESIVNNPSKEKCATSNPCIHVEDECKEKDAADQNLSQETSTTSGMSGLHNHSGDTRKSVEHSKEGANTSRESQSGSESTRRDSSPYRSPYNDSTKATYLSTKLKASSLANKENDVKGISQPIPPVRKKIKENKHLVGCNGDQGKTTTKISKKGEPSDWWDYDEACQQQRAAEVIREEKKRAEEETKAGDGKVMVDTHGNPTDTKKNPTDITGEAEVAEGVSDQGIGIEIWDEELTPKPAPLMYPSATKRPFNDDSLRSQQEHYELNIARATRTYEVYVGDNSESLPHGVEVSGDTTKGIQQSEDDVVILENSDSDDDDDDDDGYDDNGGEVPMIWGDDLAGIPQKQAAGSVTNYNLNTSATGTSGPLSQPPHILGQNVDTYTTLWNSPWNSRPMVVFQEEEDTESSLSQVEILAQRALEERRRLGGAMPWESFKFATEGTAD